MPFSSNAQITGVFIKKRIIRMNRFTKMNRTPQ